MTIDGQKLKQIREQRGYSLIKLAELAGVGKNTIHEIEHNRANPTLDTINKISKALNVDPKKFMMGG